MVQIIKRSKTTEILSKIFTNASSKLKTEKLFQKLIKLAVRKFFDSCFIAT